jgi:hypothetical protein
VDFRPSAGPTVGVEWELGLLDPATGDLVSAADRVLAAVRPPDADRNPKVHRELMLNTVELVTGSAGGRRRWPTTWPAPSPRSVAPPTTWGSS